MGDLNLKELLGKGTFLPAAGVAPPLLYVDDEVDKTGVRFEIPPIPAAFFPAGAKTLQCYLGLEIPKKTHTDLDVAGADGPFFDVEKDKARYVVTSSKAFENALFGVGHNGVHQGVVNVFYGFLDVGAGAVVYSTPIQVIVNFAGGASAGG